MINITHRFNKAISILIVLSMLCVSASASSLRNSEYIGTCSASITTARQGGINLTVNIFSVRNRTMTKIGVDHIVIQRSSNSGRTWTDVTTLYPSMSKSGTSYTGTQVVYNGAAGQLYRVVVTLIAKDDSGGDTKDITTNSIIARD